jgi:hypothetical protein
VRCCGIPGLSTAGNRWTDVDEIRATPFAAVGVAPPLSGGVDSPDLLCDVWPHGDDLATEFASAARMLMGNARACLSTDVALTSVTADGHR